VEVLRYFAASVLLDAAAGDVAGAKIAAATLWMSRTRSLAHMLMKKARFL
jgi:hypothetical protein